MQPDDSDADMHDAVLGHGPSLDGPSTADALSGVSVAISAVHEVATSKFGALLAIDVAARDVATGWTELRALVPTTGRWPVVVARADSQSLGRHWRAPHSDVVERWIVEASQLDGAAVIDRLRQDHAADLASLFTAEELLEFEAGRVEREADAHTWPSLEPRDPRYLPPRTWFVDYVDPSTRVTIALLPTRVPWEAAAHIGFGGGNQNPSPVDHVAIHRYWYDRYGAEITVMARSVVETRVARPPNDRAATTRLAFEQYTYDPDFDGTIGGLALMLHRTPWWYFWWD
jgi:hypothetical protein